MKYQHFFLALAVVMAVTATAGAKTHRQKAANPGADMQSSLFVDIAHAETLPDMLTQARPVQGSAAPAEAGTDALDLDYDDPAGRPAKGGVLGSLARVFFSLIAVAGCILLAAFGVRKFMEKKGSLSLERQSIIHTLGSLSLGAKRELYVVEVFDRVLVLGVTDSRIELITEAGPKKLKKALKKTVAAENLAPAPATVKDVFMAQFAELAGKFSRSASGGVREGNA